MARRKESTSPLQSDRLERYLKLLSQETPELRETLAKALPAHNKLLNAHAKTFDELALLPIAREQGLDYTDPLFDYCCIKPSCPTCGEKCRIRSGSKSYSCNVCKKKFTANHNSISSGSHLSSLTWMQVLLCILEFYSVNRTCDFCGISPETYYLIRSKLFYAMSILLREVKLYGNIQCDNTFVHVSYKGTSLKDDDYPDDSPFFDEDFIPREARKRGGSYHYSEKNQNNVCIFTAIDEMGHAMARYICIGASSGYKLDSSIEATKILLEAPEKDPFPFMKKQEDRISPKENTPSLLISDCEKSLEVLARRRNLHFESHVYRRDGKQVRLSKDEHNIQRINSLHRRLKDFLRKCNHVSTKYLPGYLILFEFIENTGASDEAIGHLFEILARPNLGQPPKYFENLYVTPNYMQERSNEKDPLCRYSEETLKAVYLYHRKLNLHEKITMADISKQTGYMVKSIRRNYKNFARSNLLDKVITYYENPSKGLKTSVRQELLDMYDEYAIERRKPYVYRRIFKVFAKKMNEKYGTNFSESALEYHFRKISKLEIRPPLPPIYEY